MFDITDAPLAKKEEDLTFVASNSFYFSAETINLLPNTCYYCKNKSFVLKQKIQVKAHMAELLVALAAVVCQVVVMTLMKSQWDFTKAIACIQDLVTKVITKAQQDSAKATTHDLALKTEALTENEINLYGYLQGI